MHAGRRRGSGKVQACDDKYSECLQACEGG